MSNKSINDVRRHLFAVMEGLADRDKPMEIERAKAIVDAAQTIINSAKVEVDYLKVSGGGESDFIEPPAAEGNAALPPGIVGITQHRLK